MAKFPGPDPCLPGKWVRKREALLYGKGPVLLHCEEDRFFVYDAHRMLSPTRLISVQLYNQGLYALADHGVIPNSPAALACTHPVCSSVAMWRSRSPRSGSSISTWPVLLPKLVPVADCSKVPTIDSTAVDSALLTDHLGTPQAVLKFPHIAWSIVTHEQIQRTVFDLKLPALACDNLIDQ